MWVVAGSINDDHPSEEGVAHDLAILFEQNPKLPAALANGTNTPTARVASYLAFLYRPEMDKARDLLLRLKPEGDELRHARVLLPWLRALAWIIKRTADLEILHLANGQLEVIESRWSTTMTSNASTMNDGETAAQCQNQISQQIRPWLELAQLASGIDSIIQKGGPDTAPNRQLFALADRIRNVTVAMSNEDYALLLSDTNLGRRVVAYVRQEADQADLGMLIDGLERELTRSGQFLGLQTIDALLKKGASLTADQRTRLAALSPHFPEDSDRGRLLDKIIGGGQSTYTGRLVILDSQISLEDGPMLAVEGPNPLFAAVAQFQKFGETQPVSVVGRPGIVNNIPVLFVKNISWSTPAVESLPRSKSKVLSEAARNRIPEAELKRKKSFESKVKGNRPIPKKK